ncbi:hypothetical protein DFQ27_000901 [Actinomortierella ambigua]|uniref:UDENN domain-containing protein n=1 Tax=Actinomortierella ambigua TaxID=1343610 RepID=A0A9P6QBK9_9FUNG|nr:hypothetical protein DFQ27_000901 [Actinomortierella ambigua]
MEFVHRLGPAIFVIWRAALLKKRIMICTSTPVEAACLAVYNTCLLATIPLAATHIALNKSNERIQPLFCVGTHDIEKISKLQGGYVACTTDALFRFKPELYDYLVDLPVQSSGPRGPNEARPSISVALNTPEGVKLEKISHNVSDSRRYFLLLRILSRHRRQQQWLEHRRNLDQQQHQQQQQQSFTSTQEYDDQLDSETARLLDPNTTSTSSNFSPGQANNSGLFGFNMSGPLGRMLTGGWWWWYGGDDEFDLPAQDHGMTLRDEVRTIPPESTDDEDGASMRGTNLDVLEAQINTSPEMEGIRFFHNLTKSLLVQLDRLLDYKSTSAIFHIGLEDERQDSPPAVEVTRKDLQQLGLDPMVDGPFVSSLYRVYFNKQVKCPAAHRGLGLIDLVVGTCAICCVDRGDPETSS